MQPTSVRLGLVVLLALVSASLLAAGPAASADEDADVRAQELLVGLGAEMFQQYCAVCHGRDARGDGPAAASLRTPPADLTRIAARRGGAFPVADVASFIDGRFEVDAHGSREMPIWGRRLAEPIAIGTTGEEVARGRIQILVEYLRTLQVPADADAD